MRVLDILFDPGAGPHDAEAHSAPWADPLVRQVAAALLRCYLVELQHTPRCGVGAHLLYHAPRSLSCWVCWILCLRQVAGAVLGG